MTEADLLKALAEARREGEGVTVREIMDATGWGQRRVHAALRQAIEEGRIRVTRKQTTDIAGKIQHTPSYVPC